MIQFGKEEHKKTPVCYQLEAKATCNNSAPFVHRRRPKKGGRRETRDAFEIVDDVIGRCSLRRVVSN